MKLLITGATGKIGRNLLKRIGSPGLREFSVRAMCHSRTPESATDVEVFRGDLSTRGDVNAALEGITHVVHLATCKEIPDRIMDVSVKGLFFLLEECRTSATFERFILIGGDSAMGHYFYPHEKPVVESQQHSPYPGCYPLSKVLEEVMLTQYYRQYDLNGCCLRAPWIMEKDDFRFALSFGENVFGAPRWFEEVESETAREYAEQGAVPIMLDPSGEPVKRNILHVDDLVEAILIALRHPKARQQLFNISMDEPVDYKKVAQYLRKTRELPAVEVRTRFYSNWMDNSKAKFLLNWRPKYDYRALIEAAWSYERGPGEVRGTPYPG